MKIERTESVETIITVDILCDKCGKGCKDDFGNFEGLFAKAFGGYNSWYDESVIRIDLCTECLYELCEWVWGKDKTKWKINWAN
jgi:hypothetical protein